MPKIVSLDFAPGDRPLILGIAAPQEPMGTIGLPVRDHISAATAISMLTTIMSPSWDLNGMVDVSIIQGSILTTQRNLIVQRLRGDWLLFIDDDMAWQPDAIGRLLKTQRENDLDMVGALCFRRAHPYEPTLYMRETPDAGGYIVLERWSPGQVVEVDATGLAFAVIHRRVFERIVAKANNVEEWHFPPMEARGGPPPDFFRWESYLGEDLRFCQEAKASGSRIWIDTGIEIGHMSEVAIGQRDYLASLATREPAVVEEVRARNRKLGLPTVTPTQARKRLGWK